MSVSGTCTGKNTREREDAGQCMCVNEETRVSVTRKEGIFSFALNELEMCVRRILSG